MRIEAFDDAGELHGPLTFRIGAGESVDLTSRDLENGNPDAGLGGATGPPGEGDWRLAVTSDLAIEALAYVRTSDGFVTSMHDLVAGTDAGHHVPLFNPGSEAGQVSRLRLVNRGAEAADVTIEGIDDAGRSPGTAVRLSLESGVSRTLGAPELESGTGRGTHRRARRRRRPVATGRDLRTARRCDEPAVEPGRDTCPTCPPLPAPPGRARPAPPRRTWCRCFPPPPAGRGKVCRALRASSTAPGESGTVRIVAWDDEGEQHGPLTLAVDAGETVHFTSADLEDGNPGAGLEGRGRSTRRGRLAAAPELPPRYRGARLRPHPRRLPDRHARCGRAHRGQPIACPALQPQQRHGLGKPAAPRQSRPAERASHHHGNRRRRCSRRETA